MEKVGTHGKRKKDLDQALFSLNEVGHAFRATTGYFYGNMKKKRCITVFRGTN